MIEVKCACGRVHSALDSSAGKKIKCKGCGAFLVVPLLAPSALLFEEPEDEPPPDAPEDQPPPSDEPPPPTPLFFEIPPLASATSPPREPWFYRFLESYAWFCIIVAMVQFAIVAALTLPSLDWKEVSLASLASLVPALFSFALLLQTTLAACFVLLAVDAARNLRAIRDQQRRS